MAESFPLRYNVNIVVYRRGSIDSSALFSVNGNILFNLNYFFFSFFFYTILHNSVFLYLFQYICMCTRAMYTVGIMIIMRDLIIDLFFAKFHEYLIYMK